MRENNSVVFGAREIFIVRSSVKLVVESADINVKGKWKQIAISYELRNQIHILCLLKASVKVIF